MADTGTRTRLWRMDDEEVATLKNFFVDNGFGEMVSVLDAYAEIDTEKMKRVAGDLYGTGETVGKAAIQGSGYKASQTRQGNLSAKLDSMADDVPKESHFWLNKHWEGVAYEEFVAYNFRLSEVTRLEGKRLMLMGNQVEKVATKIEDNLDAAETTLLGGASLLAGGIGSMGAGGGGPFGIAITLVGNLLQVATELEAQSARDTAEARVASDATLDIKKWVNTGVTAPRLMPEFPDDAKKWEVND